MAGARPRLAALLRGCLGLFLSSKCAGVVGGPLRKGAWWRSDYVEDRRCHEGWPAHRGFPCRQQHVHYWSRPSLRRLPAELVRGQLLELDSAPDRCPDDADLLGLTEGFGAGKHVVASRMAIVREGACRDRCDVAFVDRCGLRGRVCRAWMAHPVLRAPGVRAACQQAGRWRPPVCCVRQPTLSPWMPARNPASRS